VHTRFKQDKLWIIVDDEKIAMGNTFMAGKNYSSGHYNLLPYQRLINIFGLISCEHFCTNEAT